MLKSIKIFISYRRGSGAGYAGRIYENLKDDFDVFFDISGIAIGEEFKEKIEKEIRGATLILSILDDNSVKEFEKRKEGQDFVLFELEYAHKNSIPIIPILMNGTVMPNTEALPKALNFLPNLNAFDIRHIKFSDDVDSLKRKIHEEFGHSKLKRKLFICCSFILIALSFFMFSDNIKNFLSDRNISQSISNFLSIGSNNSVNMTVNND